MTSRRELARGAHKIADAAARLAIAAAALERELLEETPMPALTDKPAVEPSIEPKKPHTPRERAPVEEHFAELGLATALDLEAELNAYRPRPPRARP